MKPIVTLLALLLCANTAIAQTVIGTNVGAPGVLAVTLETQSVETGVNTVPATLDLMPSHWKINGTAVTAVHRYSQPWDEGKANVASSPNSFPITTRHTIFLPLGHAFAENAVYSVTTPYGTTGLTFGSRSSQCLATKVNEVAYSALANSRFANFGVFLGTGGTMAFTTLPVYDVVQESTGTVIMSAAAVDIGEDTGTTGPNSGEHVYRLPLSTVGPGGPYFVSVRGCGRSRSFGIGGDAVRSIAYVATRGLYHQRCGIALQRPYTEYTRGLCHSQIVDTRAPYPGNGFIAAPAGSATFAIRGGYHDAGDYQRRPMHTLIPLLMLAYYEGWTWHFIDSQYNIPESGNGIPDFFDEALWGLLLWENLQITTVGDPLQGGVRAGTQRDRETGYGIDSAASDTGVYGTWGVLEETTAIACGLFAQASRLVRPFDPAHADALLNRARMAWAYLQRATNVNQPATRFMYAALQLYLTTGEASFHDVFKAAAQAVVIQGAWPEQYLPGNTAANCTTAHFSSYLLPTGRATDPTLVSALKAKVLQWAATGGYMNVDTERSPYPQAVNKFYGWGAMSAQGRYADVYAWATLFQSDPGIRQKYLNTVSQLADYSLGLNPLRMSFYTGLGPDQPHSPGHADSYWTKYGLSDGITSDHLGLPIGNVPGLLLFGPTSGRSGYAYQMAVSQQEVPSWDALPIQRRYGDGWSLLNSNEFSTWETIAWNVAMLGFLTDASPTKPVPPSGDGGVPGIDAGMVCVMPTAPVCGPVTTAPQALRSH